MMELKTQKETFIGFTLGPILETMGMTSTPAGLWAASYMFSFLTRSICEYLVKNKNVSEEDIFFTILFAIRKTDNGRSGAVSRSYNCEKR